MSRIDSAWEELLTRARERQRPELPLGEYDFQQIAWGALDVRALLRALLDPRRSYRGHMEVLLAVFVAWVIAPKNANFQKAATRFAIRRVMGRFERHDSDHPIIAGFLDRTINGLNFIENIYLPSGGMNGLSKAPSRASYLKRLAAIDQKVRPLIRVAREFHYIVPELASLNYHRPSMNKIAHGVGVEKGTVDARWRDYRQTIALRYAATSMIHDGKSLLETISEGRVLRIGHPFYLAEWIGRARWYALTILMNCADQKDARENLGPLPDIELVPFEVPNPTQAEREYVRKKLLIR